MNYYDPKYIIDVYSTTFDRTITYSSFISNLITLRFLNGQFFQIRGKSKFEDPMLARVFINDDIVFVDRKKGDFFEFQFNCKFVYNKSKYDYNISYYEETGYQENIELPNSAELLSKNATIQQFLGKIGYTPTEEISTDIKDLSFKFSFAIGQGEEDFNARRDYDYYTTIVFNRNSFTEVQVQNIDSLSSQFSSKFDSIPNFYIPWVNTIL